ncbi:MAG TPA: class I SAM-dependent methyltransferase, partial [Thermoanaerobaculia bacterium]|nr:class I SAM-dependent methyltransferase [Thermoanaerobaculia bacterium]
MADERFIDAPPAGAGEWREVWAEDRRYRARGGPFEWLRKLFRRATALEAERQRNFNIVLIDLLADLRRDADAIRRDLRGDIEAVQRDARAADEMLAHDVARVRELIPVAAKRNDALIAALDQKIETLAVRIRDVVNPVVFGDRPAASDYLYRRLEDALRGDISADVAAYTRLCANHQPVLDVGCGRGELLVACLDARIDARGFDTNERSVAELRARGLDVTVAGIPECFDGIADASLGTIVAMHVVEHLPVDILFAFFREARRVLRNGGLLIVETPNAESMLVSASEFWRDPTHLAPRHPAALTVLAREHGFAIDELRAVHEFPEGTRIPILPSDAPELQRVIHAINDRLFAPQDLRLIARRELA